MLHTTQFIREHGMEALTEQYGIKIKAYPEHGLYVLNYDQIESEKAHPIVIECRGLIVDCTGDVVSRSFDRFFNLHEQPDTHSHLDMRKAVCYEKLDGSLIKVYCYNGVWYCSTRGTAFAESHVNGFDITFQQLVYQALNISSEEEFQQLWHNPSLTYIFELCAPQNRVVVRYSEPKLYLLAIRHKNGEYVPEHMHSILFESRGVLLPKKYTFSTTEECVETANALPDMQEGWVVYQDDRPVCKVKSASYLICHRTRGEGLTPKRIAELVVQGEEEEYLSYFEEDAHLFAEYVEKFAELLVQMKEVWENTKHIEGQKEFALAVKEYIFSASLFYARKHGTDVVHEWNKQSTERKADMLCSYIKEV